MASYWVELCSQRRLKARRTQLYHLFIVKLKVGNIAPSGSWLIRSRQVLITLFGLLDIVLDITSE